MPIALPPPLPPASLLYLPVLVAEAKRLRSPIPTHILAGQIDHETGCGWRKTACWNPRTEFKTTREQGVGLGQITRVFGRFDALAEMRTAHRAELAGWSWENVNDSRYQIRAIVLKSSDNYKALRPYFTEVVPAAVTAYNRGIGGVRADRRVCQVTRGCNPELWFGHVANTCAGSKAIIPGTKFTACQIRSKYYGDVVQRAQKYKKATA